MFTIDSTNKVATTVNPYAYVKNSYTLGHAYNSSLQCFVLNDKHVPKNTLDTDVEGYNRGLQERINLEYQPQGNIVFLLGTPAVLETEESLSLPVSPHALAQKLLSISSNNECKLSDSASCTTPTFQQCEHEAYGGHNP